MCLVPGGGDAPTGTLAWRGTVKRDGAMPLQLYYVVRTSTKLHYSRVRRCVSDAHPRVT